MSAPFNILVCVTQQKTCERLIRKAAALRDEKKGELFVIHVARNEWNFLGSKKEGEALEYLFGISKSFGADLTVLKSDDILGTIVEFVRKNNVNLVILGESKNQRREIDYAEELKKMLKNVEVSVVPQ